MTMMTMIKAPLNSSTYPTVAGENMLDAFLETELRRCSHYDIVHCRVLPVGNLDAQQVATVTVATTRIASA